MFFNHGDSEKPETSGADGRVYALTGFKATLMLATVNVNRLATYMPYLKAGNQNFRISYSSLLIRFSDANSLDEITEPASPTPEECFRLRNHTRCLQDKIFNIDYHTHIVCELTAVKSTVSDPPQDKSRMMATIKMDNISDVSVTLSLFDSQSIKFHTKLEAVRGDPRAVVATSIHPKIVVCFSMPHHGHTSISTRRLMLFYSDTGHASAAPLLRGYAKVEPLTIAELNEFGDKNEEELRKLQCTVSAFTCVHCNNTNAVGVLCYGVEMVIADDTAVESICYLLRQHQIQEQVQVVSTQLSLQQGCSKMVKKALKS
ncbi:hypothetical protein HID58_049415 [Brassica napus]|uniref:Uncharacterized protein n=1 Tax=Brassica napus TaxID=3708 RepID=A0ABQ8B4Z5_BRANA|nr:hypothetical protein HID58_049415 [Brassica napus]